MSAEYELKLLEQIEELKMEIEELKRNANDFDVIFGKSWQQSVEKVNGVINLEKFSLSQ